MNYTINVRPSARATVDTDDPIRQLLTIGSGYFQSITFEPTLVREDGGGFELSDGDAYARRLAAEAEAWLDYARARARMKDATLVRKALASLAFSMRHRAHDFAVPSKITGTSKHQPALWSMVKNHIGLGTLLDIEEIATDNRPRLVVSYWGEQLGEVQSKHVPWLRPLLADPFGARVFLTRITGHEREGYRLGANVAYGRVGGALRRLNHALGTDVGGDGYGGDGASETPLEAAPVEAQSLPNHGGDGASSSDGKHGGSGVRDHLRLVSPVLPVAKHRADSSAHPDDIVLYREIDGTAKATVRHSIRHSPTGIEWGYHGSGPADLARSILLQFTDESTADGLYQRFKAEVIACVPRAGGVIRAAEVRAWLTANDG